MSILDIWSFNLDIRLDIYTEWTLFVSLSNLEILFKHSTHGLSRNDQ